MPKQAASCFRGCQLWPSLALMGRPHRCKHLFRRTRAVFGRATAYSTCQIIMKDVLELSR